MEYTNAVLSTPEVVFKGICCLIQQQFNTIDDVLSMSVEQFDEDTVLWSLKLIKAN